jgi:hypothetical protein
MIAAKRRAKIIEATFASLRSKLFRFQQGVEQVGDQQDRHRSADKVFKIHMLRRPFQNPSSTLTGRSASANKTVRRRKTSGS